MLRAPPSTFDELPLDVNSLEFAAPLHGGEDVHDRLDRLVDISADTQGHSIRLPPRLPQAPTAAVRRGSQSDLPLRLTDYRSPLGPMDQDELQREIDVFRVRLARLQGRPSARNIASSAGPTADKRGASPQGIGHEGASLPVAGGIVENRSGPDRPVQQGRTAATSSRISVPFNTEAHGPNCIRIYAAPGVCSFQGDGLEDALQSLFGNTAGIQAPPDK